MNSNLRHFPVSDDLERRIRFHMRQQRNSRIGFVALIVGVFLIAAVLGWLTTDSGQNALHWFDNARTW